MSNITPKISWLYESANGTPSITAASTQTYLFGNYDEETRQQFANLSQKTTEVHLNSKRAPNFMQDASIMSNWKHDVIPTNCIPEFLFLGKSTAGTPNKLEIKDTGRKHSFTSRFELVGGTQNRIQQAVGNQVTDYFLRAGIDFANIIQLTSAWTKLETHDDRDLLTSTPILPNSVDSSFYGLRDLKWNYGEAGESDWNEPFEVEISQKQMHQVVKKSATEQEVLIGSYSAVDVKFMLVIDQNVQYDAFIDRSIVDLSFKCYKANDETKYKQIVLKNFHVENIVDTFITHGGYKMSVLSGKAESFEVYFSDGLTFATFYPSYS